MKNAARPDERDLPSERAQADLAWVMSDERGRRFMWEHLGRCGIYTNPFNTNFGMTGFNSGRASVGQDMLARITSETPELYLQMQGEAMARDKLDAALKRETKRHEDEE